MHFSVEHHKLLFAHNRHFRSKYIAWNMFLGLSVHIGLLLILNQTVHNNCL